jgi:hypothetical protein
MVNVSVTGFVPTSSNGTVVLYGLAGTGAFRLPHVALNKE